MTDELGPRTIRLVLDTPAIAAWNRGSVAVGELLAEIDDEHGAVIVPLACLVKVAHATTEQHRLDILIGHPATFVLGDEPGDWRFCSPPARPPVAAPPRPLHPPPEEIAAGHRTDVISTVCGW